MEKLLQVFAEGEGAGAESSDAGSIAANEECRDAADTGEGFSEKEDFEELIRGKYKDDFDRRVQKIINGRFKKEKIQSESYENYEKIMDALSEKYGVSKDDTENMLLAVSGKRPVSVSDEELMSLRSISPGFSLEREMQDPEFSRLLQNGVSAETAFRAVHMDEILKSAMSYTARKIKQSAALNIEKKRSRPEENGVRGASAVMTKTSVKDLSDKDLIDIERRVLRGEKITWQP